MPPPSFFTRARRIFQNASQSQQPNHPHLAPTDADHHLHYETDGSSYEMLVIDSPSKTLQVSQHQPDLKQHKQLDQDKSKLQSLNQIISHQPSHQQPEKHRENQLDQKPSITPEKEPGKDPRKQSAQHTPPSHPPSQPQTPSQKLPVALRRIDATPVKLDDTPRYNLRPRTRSRSYAPPTPQQRRTPARSRRRELRQAPSARTTSGIAARPSIISRRQIDESSCVTLRAMCRSFGLPTSGTKAELRARAIQKFKSHRVLDEQTQLIDFQNKLQDGAPDVQDIHLQPSLKNEAPTDENEENSAHVRRDIQMKADGEDAVGQKSQKPGKQITTSTVKPAGTVRQLPAEATQPVGSDEPSVHAKSDAPEKDPCRQAVNLAECSTANSPARATAQQAQKTAQPTVSSTGAAVNSPGSPRPPPPHPTPRVADFPFPVQTRDRPCGPTESVDARGGDVDVAAIFQELASGRRKLSAVEYEAVLRTLKDKAPDRLQPMQIPINVARVSLSTLPTTPNFKPPLGRSPVVVSGVIQPQKKSPLQAKTLCNSSPRPILGSSDLEKPGTGNGEAAGNSRHKKTTPVNETNGLSATRDTELMDSPEGEGTGQEKLASSGKGPTRVDEVENVDTNLNKERMALGEKPMTSNQEEIKSKGKDTPKELNSGVERKPELVELKQNPLPAIFEGARGGPHEANIVDRNMVQKLPGSVEGIPVTPRIGVRDVDAEQDGSCKDKQDGQEVMRSGFATPREMVRRFNRFRNGDMNDEEDFPLKAYADGDPASSLIRRNARRSSSGVPLFYSARGPSAAGRSIFKARTASKTRESQVHLRQMDRLHNLSGRASFRVKRPLSASAGGLLVDLRRASVSSGSPVERMDQRGSFQAELARRPPPMAASALKILNDLQQIQQESRAQANRKRAVTPPPLPPSVVKRVRRDGQFASNEVRRGQRSETGAERKGSCASLFAVDKTSDDRAPGSSVPIGRQAPRIPPIAYGAGRRKSKRSRTSPLVAVALLDTASHAEMKTGRIGTTEKAEGMYPDGDMTMTKRQQENTQNQGADNKFAATLDHSKEISQTGTQPVVPSTYEADANSKLQQPITSTVPFGLAKSTSDIQSEDQQPRETEQQKVSNRPGEGTLKMFSESRSTLDLGESERARTASQTADDRKFSQTSPQTERSIPVLNRSRGFLHQTTRRENKEHDADNKLSTAAEMSKTNALQGKSRSNPVLREESNQVSADLLVSTGMEGHKVVSAGRDDKSEASPLGLQLQDSPFNFRAAQSPFSKDNEAHLSSQAAMTSLPRGRTVGESNLGLPASPFSRPVIPSSVQGKRQRSAEHENSEGGKFIPSNTFPPLGSFKEKGSSTGAALAPSIQRSEGNGALLTPGLQSSKTSVQAKAFSATQEKEQRALLPKDVSTKQKEATAPASESAPTIAIAPLKSKEPKGRAEKSNLFTATPKAGFSFPVDEKSEGLPSANKSATTPENDEQSADRQVEPSAKDTDAMATSATPTSTPGIHLGDKSTTPIPSVTGNVLTASNEHTSPFTSRPFPKPGGESDLKPAFSFTTTLKAPDRTTSGPFAENQFKSPFSSSNSGTMFVFGSSTGNAATVKPAPSIGVLGDSATPDEAKKNPFALPTGTTSFAGSQSNAKGDGGAESSGPSLGLPSGSAVGSAFDPPTTSAVPAFESSFGSSPALFTADVNTSFAPAPAIKPFGGSTDSKTAMFAGMKATATPFGTSSGPAPVPTFGAPSSGPAAAPSFGASSSGPATAPTFGASSSGPAVTPTFGAVSSGSAAAPPFGAPSSEPATTNMFVAPSGGTSMPGFGSTAPQTFSFGNASVNPFGASNMQPNPFNQNTSLGSMSSASMFGTQGGAFNMGSATRGPPSQRRRLRGRRTLR